MYYFTSILIYLILNLLICVDCCCDTIEELSLNDAVLIAIKNNQVEVPLIKINRTISYCDYKATKSTFGSVDASGGIGIQYESSKLPPEPNDTIPVTSSIFQQTTSNVDLNSSVKAEITLPTGGTLNTGIMLPVTQTLLPKTREFKIPLRAMVNIEQPLSPSVIKQKRFQDLFDKQKPDRLKAQTISELENFILQLVSSYYKQTNLKNQLIRARKNATQSKVDADVALLKFQNGAISKTELAEIEAMRQESDLKALTIERTLVTSNMDMEELLGIDIDTSVIFSGIDENTLSLSPPDSILKLALERSATLQTLQYYKKMAEIRNHFSSVLTPSLELSYTATPKYWKFATNSNSSNQIASATMSIPLISFRDSRISLQKASAEDARASLLYKQEHRRISRSVSDFYRAIVDLRIQIEAAQKNVHAAQTSLTLAREQFVAGTISRSNLDLFIEKLENGERQLEESKTQFYTAHLQILQIQGQLLPFFGINEESI